LLIERLNLLTPSIDFEYGDSLPYNEYFQLIDRHYELRIECEQINSTLDICSKQFRAIQKRLLNKFKDKTPTLLDNLDVLLENTNQQVRFFFLFFFYFKIINLEFIFHNRFLPWPIDMKNVVRN